jgi:hypothetical protein
VNGTVDLLEKPGLKDRSELAALDPKITSLAGRAYV